MQQEGTYNMLISKERKWNKAEEKLQLRLQQKEENKEFIEKEEWNISSSEDEEVITRTLYVENLTS